jgi:hypothetical protein
MISLAGGSLAFGQAGSTGGTIGKQDKSISSAGDAVDSQRAEPERLPRSASPRRAEEKAHDTSSGCGRIIGEWQWPLGQKIVFKSGGLTQSSRGDTGTWTCKERTVIASWKSGYIDHVTLSPDGTQLSVTNNVFGSFSARK